jgi:hypothetical protein
MSAAFYCDDLLQSANHLIDFAQAKLLEKNKGTPVKKSLYADDRQFNDRRTNRNTCGRAERWFDVREPFFEIRCFLFHAF